MEEFVFMLDFPTFTSHTNHLPGHIKWNIKHWRLFDRSHQVEDKTLKLQLLSAFTVLTFPFQDSVFKPLLTLDTMKPVLIGLSQASSPMPPSCTPWRISAKIPCFLLTCSRAKWKASSSWKPCNKLILPHSKTPCPCAWTSNTPGKRRVDLLK